MLFLYSVADGGWGPWSPYSDCSASCGAGEITRTRFCNNPIPEIGGADCVGEAAETENCESETQCPSENLPQSYVNTVKLCF